jgi:hypothetical protein
VTTDVAHGSGARLRPRVRGFKPPTLDWPITVRGGLWRECGRADAVLSLVFESSVHASATRCSPRHE